MIFEIGDGFEVAAGVAVNTGVGEGSVVVPSTCVDSSIGEPEGFNVGDVTVINSGSSSHANVEKVITANISSIASFLMHSISFIQSLVLLSCGLTPCVTRHERIGRIGWALLQFDLNYSTFCGLC